MDQWFELNAAVYVLDGFSGHADRNDLAWWYGQTGGKIGKAFLVHGEPASLEALKPLLQPHVETDVIIPERSARVVRGLSEPGRFLLHRLAFVRYQSPDDSAFLVFDASRFRVDHGIFLLEARPAPGPDRRETGGAARLEPRGHEAGRGEPPA